MKKLYFALVTLALFAATSCATLQEDIYVSSNSASIVYESIEDYENSFIHIDCTYLTENKLSTTEVATLLAQINVSDPHMEPAVKARLLAFQGLLYLYQGKSSKANDIYNQAKGAQAGDSYVLLLGTRLEKSNAEQLETLEKILRMEPEDAILILEKAKVLYVMHNYDAALASIDKAFLILEKHNQENYRLGYAPLQETIWQMYQLNNSTLAATNIPASKINDTLNAQTMVSYTVENSTLLNFFTAGAKYKTADLVKRLEKSGYFSNAKDTSNADGSSVEITKAKVITRKMAARYLWNIYIQNKGRQSQLTKYSDRYEKMANPRKPIADVELSDDDINAILGVIENEIMELPDGKNFYPDEKITVIQFIACLQAAQK